MSEFLELFGNFTIGNVVTFITACGFMIAIFRKVQKYLIDKHEIEQQKDQQLNEMLDMIKEFGEYRKESKDMQDKINEQIQELKTMQKNNTERLEKIEEENKRRECNRLRDILLQSYRYYTGRESKCWNHMEHDTFWEIYNDYTTLGGNSYMHTVVGPAMQQLTVVDHNK